ncbi:TPA: hypothetical protein DEF17_03360 [bacterium]|nr:MAG: hypothetical protein AUJ18_05840 [Candidatus Hydrogenedentes bacterium CG1_02_42_14]HBW46957.1 hypothetical protein [bacterium]
MNDEPILGIWGYSSDSPQVMHHDSGAAIIIGGKITAAVNEERITRKKNEGCWPAESIRYAISASGITPLDIRRIAMAGLSPLSRSALMIRELVTLFRQTGIVLPNRWLYSLLTAKKIRRFGPLDISAPISFVGHHDAHAASAFFTSQFPSACVVTLDGIGDSAICGGVYIGKGNSLKCIRSFNGYASLGLLYSSVTKAFGFRPARHEGKITGLAAMGDSNILINKFRDLLRYENRRLVSEVIPRLFMQRVDAEWKTEWIDEMMDTHSREDIAAALQRHTEEIASAIVRDALEDTGEKNAALAGGVFANVRVNQKILEIVPGKLWIHPNMGDGGLCVGAALHIAKKQIELKDVYLGETAGEASVSSLERAGLIEIKDKSVAAAAAQALSKGFIVGRAAERMEYGPRALGNRTIFAEADDASINDTLNKRLKRTEFMPFAPIMTESAAKKYLKGWSSSDEPSRFMTITYDVTDSCREDAPAIVHVDGTARPQVVRDDSGFLKELLVEYGRITGKEILINTSFNMHEEPIVRTAEDAIRSFESGAVDLLIIENKLYKPKKILSEL